MATSDAKPRKRKRDRTVFEELYAEKNSKCVLCGLREYLEIHHVLPRSQGGDDVRENLVWLCMWDHDLITLNDRKKRHALGRHLLAARWDVIDYINERAGEDWLRRRLYIQEEPPPRTAPLS